MTPRLTPSRDEFPRLARQGNVIPIFAELIGDAETPVSALAKLCSSAGHSFLFESTEKNDVSGRFSFLGIDPRAVITSRGRELLVRHRGTERTLQIATDPLDELRKL